MKNCIARDLADDTVNSIYKTISKECRNPILVHKKFEMKDVYYRKKQPDKEILRCELSFDFNICLLVLTALIITIALTCRMMKSSAEHRIRRESKHRLKKKAAAH